ncbi:MAG: hypothetical protein AB4057_00455 [Crocosphaera sp.]
MRFHCSYRAIAYLVGWVEGTKPNNHNYLAKITNNSPYIIP